MKSKKNNNKICTQVSVRTQYICQGILAIVTFTQSFLNYIIDKCHEQVNYLLSVLFNWQISRKGVLREDQAVSGWLNKEDNPYRGSSKLATPKYVIKLHLITRKKTPLNFFSSTPLPVVLFQHFLQGVGRVACLMFEYE